jgi:hypothetical protein
MSEYQYYEFAAIDRPLTRDDMATLRSISSRATISPTSFVNEYHWGDLKADPAQWMRRYFDAFVYTANWCSCRFALRLSREVFKKADLTDFANDCSLTIDDAATHWIINWSLDDSEDDERFGMEDGRGWMGRLAPLRDELMRGDLRPLYLGWLAGASSCDVDDDAHEPEVPPGMAQLSAAQQALVEFLGIDPDLVAAAAAGSQEPEEWTDDDSVETWVAGLSRNEMRIVFTLLLQGEAQLAERRVKSEFFEWQRESGTDMPSPAPRRTIAELLDLAETAQEVHIEQETQEQTQLQSEQREKREAFLATMAADFDRCWSALDACAEHETASSYEQVKCMIADLADAYAGMSRQADFDHALRLFVGRHAKRAALVRRLVAAGLWQKR